MRYLYKITNLINGKCYIGQTNNFQKRVREHCGININSLIHKAIVKYGKENFKFEILCAREDSFIDEVERIAIKYYSSLVPNGYNLESGGCKNKTTNKETKDKIRKSIIGKKRSDETRLKMSQSRRTVKKRTFSKEARLNMSKAQIGKKRTEEMKTARSISQTGKKRAPFSEEARRNMSLCKIGKPRKKKDLL